MTTNCKHIQDKLSQYLDGELTEVEKAEIHQHLHSCETCRIELSELEAMVNAIRSLPKMSVPEGFDKKVFSTLLNYPGEKDKKTKIISLIPKIAAAAAGVLLVFFLGLLYGLRQTPEIIQRRMAEAQQEEMTIGIDKESAEAEVAEGPTASFDMLLESEPAPAGELLRRTKPTSGREQEEDRRRSGMRGRDLDVMGMSAPAAPRPEEQAEIKPILIDSPPTLETLRQMLDTIEPIEAQNLSVHFDTEGNELEIHLEVDMDNRHKLYSLLQEDVKELTEKKERPAEIAEEGFLDRLDDYVEWPADEDRHISKIIIRTIKK